MPRHLVCLGFDLVAQSDAHALVAGDTQVADDVSVAAARILDLLADRGLVATWFVPGAALARAGALVERLMRDGHEIALLSPASADIDAVAQGAAAVRTAAGLAPRGLRMLGGVPSVSAHTLAQNGFRYDASGEGSSWWPRWRDDGTVGAGPGAGVVAMPAVLALQPTIATAMSARAVMQDWSDEVLQMRDSVNFGVLTCAMPLAVIGRGAMLRAFATVLDTAAACGAAIVTFEAAARDAAERIGAA